MQHPVDLSCTQRRYSGEHLIAAVYETGKVPALMDRTPF